MRKIALCFFLLACLCCSVSFAFAQETTKKQAYSLFEEGKKLFETNREEAKEKLRQALTISKELDLETVFHRLICHDLLALAQIAYADYDWESMIEILSELIDIASRENFLFEQALALKYLSQAYVHVGEPLKELQYAKQAQKIFHEIRMIDEEILMYAKIGEATWGLGRFNEALKYFEEGIAMARKFQTKAALANLLYLRGCFERSMGHYGDAYQYVWEALQITLKECFDFLCSDACYGELSDIARHIGDLVRAKFYAEKAVELASQGGKTGPLIPQYFLLAEVYTDLGEYDKAIDSYKKSLQHFRAQIFPENRKKEMIEDYTRHISLRIGRVYLEQGNYAKAFAIFKEYDEPVWLGKYYLLKRQFPQAETEFQRVLSGAGNDEQRLIALLGLGKVAEETRNWKKAREYYQEAVSLMENQRYAVPFENRFSFMEGKVYGFERLMAYEGLVRALVMLKKKEEAFLASEYTKARTLSEAIARNAPGALFDVPQEVREKERSFADRFAQLDEAWQKALLAEDKKLQRTVKKNHKALEKEYQTFLQELKETYPEYAAIAHPEPLPARKLPLQKDETLLVFEVLDSTTFLFVIKDKKVARIVEIPIARKDLTEKVLQYRKGFQVERRADLRNLDLSLGYELYTLLLQEGLKEAKSDRVLVVPDEILGLLPFEGLPCSFPASVSWEAGSRNFPYPEGVTFVGAERTFTLWHSATSLALSRYARGRREMLEDSLLAVVNPVFGFDDERVKLGAIPIAMRGEEAVETRREITAIIQENTEKRVFTPLPSTVEMAQALQEIWGKVKVLEGVEASEEKIKALDLSAFSNIVFATHGILDTRTPYLLEPAIVLSNPIFTGEKEDGFLTASEVMNLKLQADCVATLACVTGMGKVVGGEGVMHLGRAFQYAGAESVLISLWEVENESTNLLAEEFFRALREGKGKDEALYQSRKRLQEEGYRHPFFWAAFILFGER